MAIELRPKHVTDPGRPGLPSELLAGDTSAYPLLLARERDREVHRQPGYGDEDELAEEREPPGDHIEQETLISFHPVLLEELIEGQIEVHALQGHPDARLLDQEGQAGQNSGKNVACTAERVSHHGTEKTQ